MFKLSLISVLMAGTAALALADQMIINFTPTLVTTHDGSRPRQLNLAGSITTDDVCQICTISALTYASASPNGLLDVNIPQMMLELNAENTFHDLGSFTYNRQTNSLYGGVQSLSVDFLTLTPQGEYRAVSGGDRDESGVFQVVSVIDSQPDPVGELGIQSLNFDPPLDSGVANSITETPEPASIALLLVPLILITRHLRLLRLR